MRPYAAPTGSPGPEPGVFKGVWHVVRRVVDHRGRVVHRFEGTATIGADSFLETGETRIGTNRLASSRAYDLVVRDGEVAVRFRAGGAFVTLGLCPSQRVTHLCGDDVYDGRLLFRSLDDWAEAWRVTGPRKRYSSLARYRRASADGGKARSRSAPSLVVSP